MPGVPGRGGPVPKRSSQRRRRNKPVWPVARLVMHTCGCSWSENDLCGRNGWLSVCEEHVDERRLSSWAQERDAAMASWLASW